MSFGTLTAIVLALLGKREEIMRIVSDGISLFNRIKGLWPSLGPQLEALASDEKTNAPATTTGKTDYSVEWLQESLNKLVDAKLAVDGDYGSKTREAVKKFQQQAGLDVDGWAGIQTQSAIVDRLAAK